jgi:hypothetical protein
MSDRDFEALRAASQYEDDCDSPNECFAAGCHRTAECRGEACQQVEAVRALMDRAALATAREVVAMVRGMVAEMAGPARPFDLTRRFALAEVIDRIVDRYPGAADRPGEGTGDTR